VEWWQWTGLGCIAAVLAFVCLAGLLAKQYERTQAAHWIRGDDGVLRRRDTERSWGGFVHWTREHIDMELDFRGPNELPFNRPPGMTVEAADWNRWWLDYLDRCGDYFEHPQRHRDHIIEARRAAGLPELTER
jgi:hypothetical protein